MASMFRGRDGVSNHGRMGSQIRRTLGVKCNLRQTVIRGPCRQPNKELISSLVRECRSPANERRRLPPCPAVPAAPPLSVFLVRSSAGLMSACARSAWRKPLHARDFQLKSRAALPLPLYSLQGSSTIPLLTTTSVRLCLVDHLAVFVRASTRYAVLLYHGYPLDGCAAAKSCPF
jgi:hypothetical protein